MQAPVTRQDLQAQLDQTKNRLFQRLPTKQDIQVISDSLRSRLCDVVQDLHNQDLQVTRQSLLLSDQAIRRINAAEARLISMEQELKAVHQLLLQLAAAQQPQAAPPQPAPFERMFMPTTG